jgi:prephenate dehydrogenase
MKVAIVGLGLIGGSMAIALRDKRIATALYGVDNNVDHQTRAKALGLVDECLPLADAVRMADLVVVAIPVTAADKLLPAILDLTEKQVIMDVGSTKGDIVAIANKHAARGRYVATHPMWGTENSGPDAAVSGAFVNKAVVICDKESSDADALATVENLYRALGMHILYMNATAHDLHAAYVSHISHITSFALANTVLEKEREEDKIFEMASAGFESTVRLAKSNPAMWSAIFMQNRENVLDVLNEHIAQLRKFKSCLEKENFDYLVELIEQANGIKRILK